MPESKPQTADPAPPPDADDTGALAAAARNGDRFAFSRLADRYHERIYKMIFYRTRSDMEAEDIAQEVFLQAFRSIGRLKDTDRFEAWLYRIAMNRVTDYHRKKKFRSLFSPLTDWDREDAGNPTTAPDQAPVERLVRAEFWAQVRELLDRLSRMEREVFLLRFFDELGIKDISQVLQKSESTVKTHLYRAIAKFQSASSLRDYLGEDLP
jgi:RNA polymerase sigma-70 factor (ECF subfamily)